MSKKGIITDPIGDLLIRIKNANQRKLRNVKAPYSTKKETILNILKQEGYITDFEINQEKKDITTKEFDITLKYKGNTRVITGVKRISKPSLRVYVPVNKIPQVLTGFGIAIISTSKGVVTDRKARELGEGGEIIAYVW